METSHVTTIFHTVDLILNREKESLQRTALDWARWDDTYMYMSGHMTGESKTHYEVNLQEATLRQIEINFMYFINNQGEIVCHLNKDLDDISENFFYNWLAKPRAFIKFAGNSDIHSGMINVENDIFIITALPVTTRDEQSPGNGVLVIGRKLNNALFDYISSVTQAEITLDANIAANTNTEITMAKTGQMITASKPFVDVDGNNGLKASLTVPREGYITGKYYFKALVLIMSVILVFILFAAIFILHKYLLIRLTAIQQFIRTITKTKETHTRLHIPGKDGITDIADSINEMLSEWETACKKGQESEARIKAILEATDDGYYEYNLKTKEYYISPKWSRLSEEEKQAPGFDPQEEYKKRIHPDFQTETMAKYDSLLFGPHDYGEIEYQMIGPYGKYVWVLHKLKVMERDDTGKAVRFVCVLLNITKRKEYEEKILKLSYYDPVTGLHNRAFMEEKLSEISTRQDLDYSIIMGDVNGLKLVNDTFGHKEGDRIIRTIGQILQEACAADDIAARWGGDEFVILTLHKNENYIGKLMQNIKVKSSEVNTSGFMISIALGYANKKEQPDAEAVMNLAEERMHRSKLTESHSSRSATIASLEQTLYEKHNETEEHTQRIKDMAMKLGAQLHLSPDQLSELELLSYLHDIGKIGIPEHILMKPGKLTQKEWIIIKQHTEIGYRIAKSTPELYHVAEEILSHHERYDGTGYPQGLSGESIPILSRIIAIVDSYDVMTHKRIYKDASPVDYAVMELKRCAGSQFDPVIVSEFLKLLEDEDRKNLAE